MNVLNDYTRIATLLIENLSLSSTDDSKLTILRAGNSDNTTKNPTSVKLYNTYIPTTPVAWDFAADGAWKTYCTLDSTLQGSGTYVILITYGTVIYSGILSYYSEYPSIDDEIILHASGNLKSDDGTRTRLFAKTAVDNGKYVLQLATSAAEENANLALTIKFRKLL